MNVYKVKSASSKMETIYLILAFAVILVVSGSLLKLRQRPIYFQKINNNEISSYKEFNSIELGIYSEILNSFVDIEAIYSEIHEYPDIKTLQEEDIPPFAKDEMWENRGSIEWNLVYHDNEPIYIGKSGDNNITGSFIVAINTHDIDKSLVYYTKKEINTSLIKNRFDNIRNDFKLVVSYTGDDERKKFKEN